MLPVQRWEDDGERFYITTWLSVVAVAEDGRLTEAGRISHEGRPPSEGGGSHRQIRRSFVVGDVLYTLSGSGILSSDLHSLAERSWLPF